MKNYLFYIDSENDVFSYPDNVTDEQVEQDLSSWVCERVGKLQVSRVSEETKTYLFYSSQEQETFFYPHYVKNSKIEKDFKKWVLARSGCYLLLTQQQADNAYNNEDKVSVGTVKLLQDYSADEFITSLFSRCGMHV